jgi:DNA polymerase-3 subunit delta
LKFFDLKKSLSSGETSAVYYFYGEDRFLVQRGIELIKERFLKNDFDYNIFDCSKITGENLINLVTALKSYPMLSEKRIVLAEGLNITDKDYKSYLEDYFNNPNSSSILLITESESSIKKFDFKKLRGVTNVDCNRGEASVIIKWIYTEFKKAGIEADTEAIELMCDYTLCSMTRLSNETVKLIDYSKGGRIDIDAVKKLVAKDSDYQLYEMTNEIAKGNFNNAIVILNDLKDKGINEQILLIKIFSYFRSLFHISVSDKTNKELSSVLKVKEYAVKMMRMQAQSFSKKNLKLIVEEIAKYDAAVKSGKIDIINALQITVYNILMKSNSKVM